MWEGITAFGSFASNVTGLVLLRTVDYTENRLFFGENTALETVFRLSVSFGGNVADGFRGYAVRSMLHTLFGTEYA